MHTRALFTAAEVAMICRSAKIMQPHFAARGQHCKAPWSVWPAPSKVQSAVLLWPQIAGSQCPQAF